MIIIQSGLVTLNYAPDTDILIVTWSNTQPLSASEMQESMHQVIETINKYQCRNVIIDASNAITILDDTDFRTSLAGFIAELSHTNIQKLARILTPYPAREENFNYLQSKLSVPFQLQDCSNLEEALKWLSLAEE